MLGRFPGGRHGNPLQYSCLENPTDRGASWAIVRGVTELDTTEQLSLSLITDHTYFDITLRFNCLIYFIKLSCIIMSEMQMPVSFISGL